ncbi:MAG: MarR family transcriptional regulator, partial [Rivularia sp. (in: cyanobacteria)]
NTTKIQGKFYPLQHEEWLKACQQLTPAQKDVLYYIRTLDPYNQGIDINCAEIARQLSSSERIVHRQTVSRALKELDVKGFIDLELLQVKTKVKPKGLWCDETPQVCEDTQGAMRHRDRSPRTMVDRDAPCAIATHHAESESPVDTESQNSKINKTYKDFKDSLSEDERESFLEFSKNKAASLPKPPQLPMKWIEANFEELKNLWEQQNNTYGSHSEAATSTNVLGFENWDASTHEGQYFTLMNLGLARFCENRISKAWYEWAVVKYPHKFVDVPE